MSRSYTRKGIAARWRAWASSKEARPAPEMRIGFCGGSWPAIVLDTRGVVVLDDGVKLEDLGASINHMRRLPVADGKRVTLLSSVEVGGLDASRRATWSP